MSGKNLRAGPLSTDGIIDLLNARFENVWMLAKQAEALAADEQASPELRRLAAALVEHYAYPVDFQVLDTTGQLHAQGEANRMVKPYRQVLLEGLE